MDAIHTFQEGTIPHFKEDTMIHYKKIGTSLLLAGALFCAALPSVSAEEKWYWVDSDSDFSTYADTDSLITNGGYAKIWVKNVYTDGHFDMIQYLFYAPSGRFAIVNAASYDKNGNQISVYTPQTKDFDWKPVVPDSLAAKINALV